MTLQNTPTQNFTNSLHTPAVEGGMQSLRKVFFSVCYEPLACFLGSGDMALIIQRFHYWLENGKSGYLFRDGRKRVYSGYIELTQQFAWLSVDQLGRMIRRLEEIGWLVSDRFYNLKRHVGFVGPVPQMQEDNQRKWYYLDYQRIFEDTGFDLLRGKAPAAEQPKRARGANLQNCIDQSANSQVPICNSADTSIYKEFQNNSKFLSNDQKEKIDCDVVKPSESANGLMGESHSADVREDLSQSIDNLQEVNHKSTASSAKVKVPPPRLRNQKVTSAGAATTRTQKFEWEVQLNQPHSDFVRWRANTHYIPQGGHWAAGAESHAFSEIVNKSNQYPEKANALWQQFLEYANRSADNAQARIDNGMEAWLPSCFDEKPQLDAAVVGNKLASLKEAVKAESLPAVAEPPQTLASTEPSQPTEERVIVLEDENGTKQVLKDYTGIAAAQEVYEPPTFEQVLKIKQSFWKNCSNNEGIRNAIKQWAEKTPGVVMTPDGPVLVAELTPEESECESSAAAPEEMTAETEGVECGNSVCEPEEMTAETEGVELGNPAPASQEATSSLMTPVQLELKFELSPYPGTPTPAEFTPPDDPWLDDTAETQLHSPVLQTDTQMGRHSDTGNCSTNLSASDPHPLTASSSPVSPCQSTRSDATEYEPEYQPLTVPAVGSWVMHQGNRWKIETIEDGLIPFLYLWCPANNQRIRVLLFELDAT